MPCRPVDAAVLCTRAARFVLNRIVRAALSALLEPIVSFVHGMRHNNAIGDVG